MKSKFRELLETMGAVVVLLICMYVLMRPQDVNAWQIYQGPGKSSDTVVQVSPDGTLISDSAAVDAAGRSRSSGPYSLYSDSRLDDIGAFKWEDVASGVGATSTFNANEATVSLTVGTGAADYEYRQSRYIQYIPGKSQNIKVTFVMGAPVTNVAKRVGYFDDRDGLFFQQLGTVNSMCLRTSTSGSPVDSCTPQSAWNIDKMDGTGRSGVILDSSKAQLLVIDFLWQGVGRVRYGFNINGKTYFVHQVLDSNILSLPYIATPSLPVRYEIRNVGVSVGGSMKQICVSVESEGGEQIEGLGYAASNGINIRAVTTRAPIFAIRLANTYDGKPNRKLVKLIHHGLRAATNDAFCEMVHVHQVTATAGGAWVAVDPESGVEYNAGITSVTAGMSHVIDTDYIAAGQGQATQPFAEALEYSNMNNSIWQNAASTQSSMFVVYCTAFSGTANVSTELNWIEER